jgi:uncharacterized membrane protein
MSWYLMGVAGLHVFFMAAELFPWSLPVLLHLSSKTLPDSEPFTCAQRKLVANIVDNAAIYNGIVAGGLFWAAFTGDSGTSVARVMLIGAAVAGVFGTATLKSSVTAFQAIVGIVGLFLV